MRRIDGTFSNSTDDRRWAASLEETLTSVCRQALVDNAKSVTAVQIKPKADTLLLKTKV